MMSPSKSNRHIRQGDEQIESRPRRFWYVIAVGSAATAFFVIASLLIALRGHDPQPWGLLAILSGIVVSVGAAFMPGLGKQQRTASAVPGPVSARRAAFVSLSSMWLALYVFAISNVHGLLGIATWPLFARLAAAIGATLSIGAVIYALLRYLVQETDEYQRLLLMRAALIAAALTFFTLTAWGLFELYVGASHMPVSLALALFCLFFAIANWWVRGRT
jgi:hypothetical protein